MKNHPTRWLAVLSPLIFVLFIEFAGYLWRPATTTIGRFWVDLTVLGVAIALSIVIWVVISRTSRTLERQNRELLALHDAGLDVAAELSLGVVLQKVTDGARNLIGARYGALSVVGEDGRIESFVTSGISDELREKIGAPPVGKGLLGVPLYSGESLCVDQIADDDRSIGFPEHHPPMHSLLAVPVTGSGPFKGNLYLTEKMDGSSFTRDDEETLRRFATQAAIAINNAALHQRVVDTAGARERERIAHEIHDGIAQLLGYVNTKAQAAGAYLRQEKIEEAGEQIRELEIAARAAFTDVREAIAGLRALPHKAESFHGLVEDYVELWSEQSQISSTVNISISSPLTAQLELQLIRIIQESLTNVRKHSQASHVHLDLTADQQSIRVVIRDNGIGYIETTRRRGVMPRFGLATMKERAESVGGTLTIEGRPGEGTEVIFETSRTRLLSSEESR